MSTFETLLTDEINVATRPASALANHFNSEDELVEWIVAEDPGFSELDGVGDRTGNKVYNWFQSAYPEKDRKRKERSESYCTEYTTDHGLADDTLGDGVTYFAFVCPRCSNLNPLKGDPEDFANRPFRCETCNWVPLLDAEAIREFKADELEGDATEVPA